MIKDNMNNQKIDEDEKVPRPIPTWQMIWQIILFRKKIFVLNLLCVLLIMLAAQIPGLAMRQFFNMISGSAPTKFGLWTVIILYFVNEVIKRFGVLGMTLTNVPFFVHSMTLLRRNMLAYILKRPGASALPDSPGEAISRFRGDVFEIPLFALWINNLIGSVVFCTIAITIMVRINASITMLTVLPFIVVGIVASMATKRIDKYRRASRKATGIVCGFIGEIFGAVQAVKVAAAEKDVVNHFRTLNEERRKIALKDRLFNEILIAIFKHSVNIVPE